jgi:sterol desaturase/sphingolipid hydroxylase (fatty acid hydroxylase superfamily)
MEALINYFETIPSLHRSLLLVGGITFFWFLEGILPLFKFSYKKWAHAIPNLFFTLTTIIINFALAFLLLKTSDWTMAHNFGVLNWLSLPFWAYILMGVLLMDFIGAYLAHYVEHKVKPLWMIHLVHHTDHNVDTTTANRHHPLESIIRFTFTLLAVFVLGAPIGIVMLY